MAAHEYEKQRITFKYKTTNAGLDIHLDVQIPLEQHMQGKEKLSVLISIHGGGLMNGSRRDPMYAPMVESLLKSGYLIVYPDYRLLQPSTCYDQLEDISDMLCHLSSGSFAQELSSHLPPGRQMDLDNISVAGFSAGSYIARILVVHSLKRKTRIQFKSCILFYGMGGDFLLDYWVKPRISPDSLPPDQRIDENEIADCPYSSHLPGYGEAERRTPWCEWWWDTARFLDLCTGEEGLSDELRKYNTTHEREEYMLERKTGRRSIHKAYSYEDIFPQLYLRDGSKAPLWPKTMLIHGTSDPSVMLEETMHTWDQLNQDSQKHKLVIVKGGNHDLNDPISGKPLEDKVKALEEAVAFIKDMSA